MTRAGNPIDNYVGGSHEGNVEGIAVLAVHHGRRLLGRRDADLDHLGRPDIEAKAKTVAFERRSLKFSETTARSS